MRKKRIFTPGPTPLIPEVQSAMSAPILHHRTDQFKDLLLEVRRNLQKIFKTENDVLLLSSSGTGAMEAAVASLFHPGEHTLAVEAGKFGQRWVEICQSHGIPCTSLRKQPGQAASAEEICQSLEAGPEFRALLIQGCETSTATSHDLEQIATAVHQRFPDVLIVVDAITALLTQSLETDAWGLDIVIGGSQKAFGLPPGLAFLSVSPRAVEKIKSNPCQPYYLNLLQELKQQSTGQTAFTPAISLVVALNEATRRILREGAERTIAEAELMSRCTRRGLRELGFNLLSSSPANAVTAAFPPDGVEASRLIRALEEQSGIKVAGGQSDLKGKIIRIAHLGYFDLLDVFSVLSAIELCLFNMGAQIDLGAGVRAALLESTTDAKNAKLGRHESTTTVKA